MADAARSSYIQIAWKINNTGYNQLMKQYDKADRRSDTMMTRMTNHLTKVGDGMLRVGQKTKVMSAAMGGALAYGVTQSAKLENRYKVITNLLTTGGEKASEATRNVKRMQQQSLGISNKYGVSQQQIGKGYEELVRRGYSSNQALAAQKTFVKGAIASGDDYADVVKNSTAALEAFGLRSNKTATMTRNTNKVVNEMAYAADLTATDFKNLGYGLTYVGSTGKTADQTVGHVSAALGELSNNGQEATVAGTGLQKVYNSLAAPGPKSAVPALKSIGLSPKDLLDSKGKMKDLADIFLLLNKHMKGMSNNKKFNFFHTMFGTTGQTSGMLLAQNAKQLKNLENQVDKAPKKNYITQLANKNMGTTLQQWKIFKQNLSNTATVMGGRLLPAANDAIKSVSGLTKWFDDLNDGQKKFYSALAIGVAAFSPVMTITGMLIKNFRTLHTLVGGTWNVIRKINGPSVFASSRNNAISAAPTHTKYGTGISASTIGDSARVNGRYGGTSSVSSMVVRASRVVVSGPQAGGGFTGGSEKRAGRQIGNAATVEMSSKSTKTGRKIGTAATSYQYTNSRRIGRRIGSTSTSYQYSNAKKIGKRSAGAFNSATYAKSGRVGSRGAKLFRSGVMAIGWVGIGTDLGDHAENAFRYGIDTKKGGKEMWTAAGELTGGIIGSFAGPMGTMIGAEIGPAVLKAIKDLPGASVKAAHKSAQKSGSTVDRIYVGNGAWSEIPNGSAAESSHGTLNPSGVIKNGKKKHAKKTFRTAPKLVTGFATGGAITKTGTTMVGENGFEVLQRGHSFQMVGKNGAQLLQTKPGDHIYKHSEATEMAHGTYGKRLPNYALGTPNTPQKANQPASKLGVTTKKIGDLGSTEKKTKRSTKKISKDITSSYSKSTSKANRSISKFGTKSNSNWKSIAKSSSRQTGKIRKNTVADFDKMQKGSQKQMTQLHSGMNATAKATTSDFGDIMGRLKPYAHKAMGGAISSLNGGISGIDSALSQFGGNNKVLKPIHYAAGSKGPIAHDQMAVLNDATSGPRQELVARGDQLLKPIGKDVVTPLRRGDSVFNGSQVERVKPYLPHFAKGTGASNESLLNLLNKNSKSPNPVWKKDVSSKIHSSGSDLQSGATGTGKSAISSVGVPWNKEAWNVMAAAANGGGDGTWKNSPGAGWSVSSGFGNRGAVSEGFSSHDGTDYSGGRTVHAMYPGTVTHAGGAPSGWGGSNGIGENITTSGGGQSLIYQELNGKSNSGAKLLVSTGDKVRTGQAIAVLGPSGTHVHVGATKHKMFSIGGSSTAGWEDVTKMHSSAKQKKAKSSPLNKFVTNQLKTAGVLPWIAKHIEPLTEDTGSGGTSAAPSGSHKHWLKQAGIPESWWSATNEIISAESGWNPKARNSSGAYGLPQSLPASKMASAGSDWRTNPITQLKWYKSYIKSRYGGINQALAFRHAHGWYKSGGNPPANQPVVVGENGPELATFDSGTKIHNNRETKSLFSKAKGSPKVSVNMTVNVQGSADDKVIPKFRKVVHQELVKILTNELGNAFD